MAVTRGLGFGIVGIGVIADCHAQAMRAMRGGRLVCAFSRHGGTQATAFAERYNIPLYVQNYDAFLAHPQLDVVVILTPSGAHLEPALAAARAGKHILCEKPLEITLERCDAMIAVCAQQHVQLGCIFQHRTSAAAQAIKQARDAQRFGRLTVCNALVPWYRSQAYYDSAAWRGTWSLDGGGALMNQGIHTIDLLQWLAGPVKAVHAFAGTLAHERVEVEDTAVAIVQFASGALGTIVGSTTVWPGYPLEVHLTGPRGSAYLRGSHLAQWQFVEPHPGDAQLRRRLAPQVNAVSSGAASPRPPSIDGHRQQFENFVRSLRGSEPLLVDGPEARHAVEIVLAIYASALSGQTVSLPLSATLSRQAFARL